MKCFHQLYDVCHSVCTFKLHFNLLRYTCVRLYRPVNIFTVNLFVYKLSMLGLFPTSRV